MSIKRDFFLSIVRTSKNTEYAQSSESGFTLFHLEFFCTPVFKFKWIFSKAKFKLIHI